MTRLRLAVALDDAPDCPACELDEQHAHRLASRRSLAAVARERHVPARELPRRPGAPRLMTAKKETSRHG